MPACVFYEDRAIINKEGRREKMKINFRYLLVIFIAIGYIFSKSGYEKVVGGKFVDGLLGTLGKFASNNPYPIVKDFLNQVVIPNSTTFGTLTMWGELFSGISILVTSLILFMVVRAHQFVYLLLLFGLVGGAFLNLIFWLSAGWTSPSTDSLNFLMLIVQSVGVGLVFKRLVNGDGVK